MPETVIDKSVVREVVNLTQKIAIPVTTEPVHFAVVPNDCQVKSLQDFQYPDGLRPQHISESVRLQDAKSFIDYVSTFSDDRTRVFAGVTPMSFQAVLDYHGAGSDRTVEFTSHKASYLLVKDQRWLTWVGGSEKLKSQQEFAEFLEDNMSDLLDPPAAAMLDVARDLHAHTECSFGSQIKLSNGQVQLKYTETVTAGVGSGTMEVPETFTIRIPVFYGEPAVTIGARLRYRLNSGKLTFFYKLYRQDEILQNAFQAVVDGIADALKMPVWLGDPGL